MALSFRPCDVAGFNAYRGACPASAGASHKLLGYVFALENRQPLASKEKCEMWVFCIIIQSTPVLG